MHLELRLRELNKKDFQEECGLLSQKILADGEMEDKIELSEYDFLDDRQSCMQYILDHSDKFYVTFL